MPIVFNGDGKFRALALLIAAMWGAQALAGQKPEAASQVNDTREHAVYSDNSLSIKYKVRSRDGVNTVVEFSATNESRATAIFQATFSWVSPRTNETQALAKKLDVWLSGGGVWRQSLIFSTADFPIKARLINIKLCDLPAPESSFFDPCAVVKSKSSSEITLE